MNQEKRVDQRALWDEKFGSGSHASMEPDPLLVEAYRDYVGPLLGDVAGRCALDLAGGTGRHAIFLAERGWRVKLLDISGVGLEIARAEGERRKVSIEFWNADAIEASFPRQRFDLIVVFFFLQRELFPAVRDAINPGGFLVYKTYTAEHPSLSGGRGPRHPMHLLEKNELLRAFAGMEVLLYRETVVNKGAAELVARKPAGNRRSGSSVQVSEFPA